MAKTVFATNDTLKKQAYDKVLFEDTMKEVYFSKFMGENADSLVHVKTMLEKDKGDNVRFGLVSRLTADPIINGTLEGNEQSLTWYNHNVTLNKYRNGVRDEGEIDRKRSMFEIDEEAQAALKNQGAELLDKLCMDAVVASPTKIFYGGTATSTASLTTADKLTPALISKTKTWVKTGGNRTQTPLRPVKVAGKEYYVLLTHPDSMYDLKRDSEFAQAMREAQVRGGENPLFSGATAIWDGVVIHEHENVPIVTNWGAGSVPGAKAVFMGAQSLVWAWGRRPKTIMETFDYQDEHGYSFDFIAGVNKPKFNSVDYGSVAVYVARTQISDAS